jgi:hypothetical protein
MNKKQIEELKSAQNYLVQAAAAINAGEVKITPEEFAKIALVVWAKIDSVLKG